MAAEPLRIEAVDESWERDAELAAFLFDELYRDFGVCGDDEWRHAQAGSITVVALGAEGKLLGSARLLPGAGEPSRQVRQVAVAPQARDSGVGRALMESLERQAASEGAVEMWLNARDSAIAFYRRLGYEPLGERFTSELTGIVHVAMRKPLK